MAPDGTGTVELVHDSDPANLGFAWAPDGTEMAIVGITGARYDRTVRVLDLATGLLSPISEPGSWYGPSWQPVAAANDPTAASTSTWR